MNSILRLAPLDLGLPFTCDFEGDTEKLFSDAPIDHEIYRAFVSGINPRKYAAARAASASSPSSPSHQQLRPRSTTHVAALSKSTPLRKIGSLASARNTSPFASEDESAYGKSVCTTIPEEVEDESSQSTPPRTRSSTLVTAESPHSSTSSAHALSHKNKSANLRLEFASAPVEPAKDKEDDFCVCGLQYHPLYKAVVQCADCDEWYHLRCVDQDHTLEYYDYKLFCCAACQEEEEEEDDDDDSFGPSEGRGLIF